MKFVTEQEHAELYAHMIILLSCRA